PSCRCEHQHALPPHHFSTTRDAPEVETEFVAGVASSFNCDAPERLPATLLLGRSVAFDAPLIETFASSTASDWALTWLAPDASTFSEVAEPESVTCEAPLALATTCDDSRPSTDNCAAPLESAVKRLAFSSPFTSTCAAPDAFTSSSSLATTSARSGTF